MKQEQIVALLFGLGWIGGSILLGMWQHSWLFGFGIWLTQGAWFVRGN